MSKMVCIFNKNINQMFFQLLVFAVVLTFLFTGCTNSNGSLENQVASENEAEYQQSEASPDGTLKTGSLWLEYATEFLVDYYEGGYIHVCINDGNDYVLVPEGADKSNLGYENAAIVCCPQHNIYLAATSAMDLFKCLDSLQVIKCCSTKAEDYSMPEVSRKIKDGDIVYVGKYSAPDFELLLENSCELAIESTMIYHTPKIKEQLENLGIPVLVERSSYEAEPLGRLEWIKLYGILAGKEEEALSYFQECRAKVEEIISNDELHLNTGNNGQEKPSVLFFYISSNGYVNVRKPGDYVTRMIEMAGGRYALEQLQVDEENSMSTMNIQWEDFYSMAVDADILIYNSTIDGGVSNIDELLDKNMLLADFKSVQNGNAFCTNKNMFQEGSCIADIIVDFYKVINGDDATEYIYKLN